MVGLRSSYSVASQCFLGNVVDASCLAYIGHISLNQTRMSGRGCKIGTLLDGGGKKWRRFVQISERWMAEIRKRKTKRDRSREKHTQCACKIFFKCTLLSSRFCRASFPVLSLISTFLGWEMSVCRSMTRPSLLPLHAESASKSSVLLSEEPSTGQNMPQNFCLGLAGLSEPMLLKNAGTSPAVDMPSSRWGCVCVWVGR